MRHQPGDSPRGLLAALTIMGLWAGSLVLLLSTGLETMPGWLAPLAILWQTFLYTGLFITAHDAMHGSAFPAHRGVNDALGTLAVILYALFSFEKLHTEHWEHHRHPASADDPDFHDGAHPGLVRWYLHFLKHYVGWVQIAGMAVVFNILLHWVGIAEIDLALFWVAPSLLSTVQLFYFGTYLPHREEASGYADEHRARSNDFGTVLSFLTCYHFGYHWEHHAYPGVPWWRLPRVRRERNAAGHPA